MSRRTDASPSVSNLNERLTKNSFRLLVAIFLCSHMVACGGSDDGVDGAADGSATDAQTDADASLPDASDEDSEDATLDIDSPDTDDTGAEDTADAAAEQDSDTDEVPDTDVTPDTEVLPDVEADVPDGPVPTITELIPTCGPNDGSRRIVILGDNFRDPMQVVFGEETIDATVEGPGVAIQPAPVAPFEGFVSVSVTAGGVPSETVADGYWYHRGVTWTTTDLTPPADFTFMAAVGDFDDDGKDDVVVSGGTSVVLYSQFAEGAFGSRVVNTTCATPSAVAVGDVTGDNIDDIVIGCANSLQVLQGVTGGAPTVGAVSSFESGTPGYHLDLALADVNDDGDLDAMVRSQSSNEVVFLLQTDIGEFSATDSRVDLGEDLTNAWLVDVTNDGQPDIVSTHYNPGLVKVHVGQGTTGFSAPLTFSAPAVQELAFGDFNDDGFVDIVASTDSAGPGTIIVASSATGEMTLLRSLSEFTTFAPGVADFDDSGDLDVIVGGGIGLWTFLTGPPTSLECYIETAQAGAPYELYTGDFNADGVTDVLTIPFTGDRLQLNITSISDR